MRRWALIAAAIAVFLVVSFGVARWLTADGVERSRITDLLRAQAKGDADEVLEALDCPDEACRAIARENARDLRTPGELKVVRLDSPTAHSLGSASGNVRVVWAAGTRLPTVQCVLVHRKGNPLSGTSVTLLRLTRPIGRESSCP